MEKLFNYTDIKFIFLFSIKDLFRSKAKLLSISITLFLSLFIYSTILTINLSLNKELSKNQKTLLGGDLEIDYNRGKADYNLISKIKSSVFLTDLINLFSRMCEPDYNKRIKPNECLELYNSLIIESQHKYETVNLFVI